ncbi:MAG: hypothetical protein HY520_05225, partial [Candidatus Aenigmarchaeota archaeon]|nr:hypothetical protein [Candidatus Aenigmarchaeota archaeon]
MKAIRLRGALRKKLRKMQEKPSYPPFTVREPKYFVILPRAEKPEKVRVTYPLLEPFVQATVNW